MDDQWALGQLAKKRGHDRLAHAFLAAYRKSQVGWQASWVYTCLVFSIIKRRGKNLSRIKLKRDLTITIMGELFTKIPLYGFEFLLASWLVINQYAEWAALGLIYRLAPYAHFGALSYFNKRYPVLLGKGNLPAAEQIKKHTNSIINVLILIAFVIFFLLFLLKCINTATFLVICGVLTMQIYTYCQAKLRNDGDFRGYTVGLFIFSLMQFVIAYFTVKKYGVLAGVLSTFLAYLAAVFYYVILLKMNYLYFIPRIKNVTRIIKLGWAPFLLTISSFLIQISDRLALVIVDDSNKLAFYGFFALFLQIGIVTVNSLGKVLGPYILHLSGRKELADTLTISLATCYLILAIYFCLCLTLFWQGDPLIDYFFTHFSGSLIGVYNYATIGILISLSIAFYPQLIAASQETRIIKMNLGYFCISFIVIYLLAKNFSGYFIFSFASVLMNLGYSLLFLIFIEHIMRKKIYLMRGILVVILITTLGINYCYVWP